MDANHKYWEGFRHILHILGRGKNTTEVYRIYDLLHWLVSLIYKNKKTYKHYLLIHIGSRSRSEYICERKLSTSWTFSSGTVSNMNSWVKRLRICSRRSRNSLTHSPTMDDITTTVSAFILNNNLKKCNLSLSGMWDAGIWSKNKALKYKTMKYKAWHATLTFQGVQW